jgi:hypothetical protein
MRQRNADQRVKDQYQINLLSRLPHLVHPWLHLISVGFRTLRSPDVGVRVEHMSDS